MESPHDTSMNKKLKDSLTAILRVIPLLPDFQCLVWQVGNFMNSTLEVTPTKP